MRCGICGGSIVQSWQALKSVYRCWHSWSRGPAVCANTLTVPQARAELAVLRAIERDVLDPQVVDAALAFALEQLTRSDTASGTPREELRTELARIDAELARYAEAIADAGPLDAILQAIKAREDRRETIRQELKVFALRRPGEPDAREIRATLTAYLADWTAMARRSVGDARRLLREVLVDRIVFRPVPRPPEWPPVKGPGRRAKLVYELVGEASLSNLFRDLISVSLLVAPTGHARLGCPASAREIACRVVSRPGSGPGWTYARGADYGRRAGHRGR